MLSEQEVWINELFEGLEAFLPVFYRHINPVINQMETSKGTLNENQIKVLMAVSITGGVSQAEISKLFMIPKTSLTTIVRSLEGWGLVRRTSGGDRRKHELELTAAGHRLIQEKREENLNRFRALFSSISRDEAAAIGQGFRTMEKFFSQKEFH